MAIDPETLNEHGFVKPKSVQQHRVQHEKVPPADASYTTTAFNSSQSHPSPQQLVASYGAEITPADWRNGHPATPEAMEQYDNALLKLFAND